MTVKLSDIGRLEDKIRKLEESVEALEAKKIKITTTAFDFLDKRLTELEKWEIEFLAKLGLIEGKTVKDEHELHDTQDWIYNNLYGAFVARLRKEHPECLIPIESKPAKPEPTNEDKGFQSFSTHLSSQPKPDDALMAACEDLLKYSTQIDGNNFLINKHGKLWNGVVAAMSALEREDVREQKPIEPLEFRMANGKLLIANG